MVSNAIPASVPRKALSHHYASELGSDTWPHIGASVVQCRHGNYVLPGLALPTRQVRPPLHPRYFSHRSAEFAPKAFFRRYCFVSPAACRHIVA